VSAVDESPGVTEVSPAILPVKSPWSLSSPESPTAIRQTGKFALFIGVEQRLAIDRTHEVVPINHDLL